jgi:TetR/AcrR family transcriptional regulator
MIHKARSDDSNRLARKIILGEMNMASRGGSSLSARGRAKRAKSASAKSSAGKGPGNKGPGGKGAGGKGPPRTTPAHIAPIYKRLPHGPHRLERDEVVLHQRSRIHGAMIKAVAEHGYERTSVKQVIGLAGVSRRSFYEQFANKEECFLTTFDLIVRREIKQFRKLYLATNGPLQKRAQVVFQRYAQNTAADPNAAMLVVLETPSAGPAGVMRHGRATGAVEQLLAHAFAESPGSKPLPAPIVRGIAGGLHGIAYTFLRDCHNHGTLDLAQELLNWTMIFQTATAPRMSERLSINLNLRMREISSTHGHGLTGAEVPSRDERTRLLQGILRLVTREDYRALSAPQIADDANLPIDTFCELFASKEDCFLQALDMIGDQLLAIAAKPQLVSSDWPHAVRTVLAELLSYLAEHPLQARALAQEAFFAGPEALERNLELSHAIATLLTEGAPGPAPCNLITEAIAGALWHTIRCQVTAGRIQLLAALSDHLTYIVLAPFIGADTAAQMLIEEGPRVGASAGAADAEADALDAAANRA